jgi:hypothetical protein
MAQSSPNRSPIVDWLTVVAIAAIAISINVSFHEGVHALTCVAAGGDLREYSALHVDCRTTAPWQDKVVAGSASIANILAGTCLWLVLRRWGNLSPRPQFFCWLLMLMNWLYGAGYWMFSGVANIGDWATVIEGWGPHWLWRLAMAIVGTLFFLLFIWLGLRQFGRMVGGDASEQIGRANKLSLLSYATAAVVVLLAGVFFPYGLLSLPVTAGFLAVVGGLSPLAWMMQWFRARSFAKVDKAPLEIHRSWLWIAVAAVVVFLYAFVLGRTLYF